MKRWLNEFNDDGSDNGGGEWDFGGTQDTNQQQQAAPATNAPPPAAFDQARFEQSMQNVLRTVAQSQGQSGAPQMSEDEWHKVSKRYFVSDQDIRDLYGDDLDGERLTRAKAAHQRMLDANAQHAMTVAGYGIQAYTQEQVKSLQDQFAPALTYAQAQQQQQAIGAVEAKFPALKGQSQLIGQIGAYLKQSGYQATSNDDALNAIGKVAEQWLKASNPNFSLTGSNANGQQQSSRGAPPTAVNGGGGGPSGRQANNGNGRAQAGAFAAF